MPAGTEERSDLLRKAWSIVEDAWAELQRAPYVQARLGTHDASFPDVSFSAAERRSAVGRSIAGRLEGLDLDSLPHELALILRLVAFRAASWANEADWYWTAVDPRGRGQFGLFLPTAYCGGFLLTLAQNRFASFTFVEPADRDRYLVLIAAYAELLDQFSARTAGQAQRGIRLPRAQVLPARTLMARFKADARAQILSSMRRYVGSGAGDFASRVEKQLVTSLDPAFERVLAGLSEDYRAQAPDTVGMSQYAGGAETYEALVKLSTTLDLTPDQVHARGLERMHAIEESIADVQGELGFRDDASGFLAHLDTDAQLRASSAEAVAAVFQRCIDRLTPRLSGLFHSLPRAPYGVAPLPAALESSMTYGYYDAPRSGKREGTYWFNAANLTRRPLFHVAALTYHELMPGHHLHFATQQENHDLHPFCSHSFVTAYVEGWAEYAAELAGGLGLYETPQERYGRLVMDAFLTSRLVVDTGMNALGWSLERGREYMRAHSRLPEAEILTESIRYSCDVPAQALSYKLGDTQILSMRERMRSELGKQFDIRNFHAAVLGPGALPLPDLQWHVDYETTRLSRGGQ